MIDRIWIYLSAGWLIIISATVYHALAHKPLAWDTFLIVTFSVLTLFAVWHDRKHRQ